MDQNRFLAWGIASHIGEPEPQDREGRLLHDITDTGQRVETSASTRGFQTNDELNFHNDGGDAFFLLCLRTARSGGTSKLASVAYQTSPSTPAGIALRAARNVVTGGSTLYDTLALALATPDEEPLPALPEEFFLLSLRRPEHLVAGMLRQILGEVRGAPGRPTCALATHAETRAALERSGLLADLQRDPSFVLLRRQSFVAFTKLLARAELVVTDDASEVRACDLLGKRRLRLARATEPLGAFLRERAVPARPRVVLDRSPSAVIADDLTRG